VGCKLGGMGERVTLADIAKRAGVHVTTVSLALRNHPALAERTKLRLQALAEEMGYRPDPALSALSAYRQRVRLRKKPAPIAYVTHWDSRWGWKQAPAHEQFWEGASKKAEQLGYALEHFWLGEPHLTHHRLSDILKARGVDGVILASHRFDRDEPVNFEWSRFSAVKIDFFPHEPRLHTVTNDQRAIVALAVRRVLALGYRRIGLVMHKNWDIAVDRAWSAGYLAEQQTLRPEERLPMLVYPSAGEDAAAKRDEDVKVPKVVFQKWFTEYQPEVIISYGPFVLPTLAELRIQVPRDVAYVELFLQGAVESTAGVRQNCARVGELAVEILAGKLQQHTVGIPLYSTSTYVEGTWCDGASLPLSPRPVSPKKSK
jgi:LacI family transcriptional regulator